MSMNEDWTELGMSCITAVYEVIVSLICLHPRV